MPNFDVWYPFGISATIYSIMTLWLAIKRVMKKVYKLLGMSTEQVEDIGSPHPLQAQIESRLRLNPIAKTVVQPIGMLSAPEVPKNDM